MNHSLYERIVHKLKQKTNPFFAKSRQKRINNNDFTIISNNCWGGICYEYFGLPKQSPTVGTYFFADDYIKFVTNLTHYLNTKIKIIKAEESKYYRLLKEKSETNVPIGLLDDIEIVFLHYRDPEVAIQKWNRRVKRVNLNNIIIKFSYMNECNDELLEKFLSISGIKKICFVGGKGPEVKDLIYLSEYTDSEVKDDTFYWNKDVDIFNLINQPVTEYKLFKYDEKGVVTKQC